MEVEEIVRLLSEADDKYYNYGNSNLTDIEYDQLKEELFSIIPNHPYFETIGAPVKKAKINLPFYLPSLDKIKDLTKLNKWTSGHNIIVTDKLDGVSAMFIKKSNNMFLYTRGNGYIGGNISKIIPYISGIPCLNEDIICRGELIISKDKYMKMNLLNPRNVVVGLLATKTPDINLLKMIEFISYEIIDPIYEPVKQLEILENKGFNIPFMTNIENINNIKEFLQERKLNSKYDVDGLVLTYNEIYDRVEEGYPKYMIAFKTDEAMEYRDVEVIDIEWNVSVHGYIKPTIIITPTVINGVNIQRVTGANAAFIKNNNIGKYSIIRIIRSGDVIPKVIGIIKGTIPLLPENIRWKWNDTNVDIIINEEKNEELIKKKISYFFEKMKVAGLKEGTINKIYENTKLKTIKDIVNCEREDLICKGIGEKTAISIHENIKNMMKNAKLEDIMIASNCFGRGMGENKIKMILKEYKYKIDDIRNDNMKRIEGISEDVLNEFIRNIKEFKNFKEEIGFNNENKEEENKEDKDLKDIICCFTGFRDEKMKTEIERRGGEVKNTLTKKCNILIVSDKDEDNIKQIKGKEMGIEIIKKEDFYKKYLI
jgi:NAD-dependent DNA ligase